MKETPRDLHGSTTRPVPVASEVHTPEPHVHKAKWGVILRASLTSSSFVRSVATLASGSGISMVLPIIAAPLLGRLYSPEDYGVLGAYMAIAAILGPVSVLQFDGAIIAEDSDERAGGAAWLCVLLALATSSLTVLALLLYSQAIEAPSSASRWFFLLPTTVLCAGLNATALCTANRERLYGYLAKSQVLLALLGLITSISLGLRGWGATGLMVSYFAGQAAQGCRDIWILSRSCVLRAVGRPTLGELAEMARRHWRFPVFTIPTALSGQFSRQLPLIAMDALGSPSAVGSFSRARQLVSMPITLLGRSAAQVFRREASEDYRRTGTCRPRSRRLVLAFVLLGGLPCCLFVLWAPQIMTLILGPKWHAAGEMARVLAPMLFIRLISLPLASIYYFTDRQALALKMNLFGHIPLSLSILAATSLDFSPLGVVMVFSGGYSLIYLVEAIIAYRISSQVA